MQPAPFVTDPARDADVEIEIKIGMEVIAVAGEAVDHGRPEPVADGLQDLDEPAAGVALVHEDGEPDPGGDLELRLECPLLVGARREVPIEIETGLADRDHLLASRERLDRGRRPAVEGRRLVRVDAGRGAEPAGMAAGERRGRLAVRTVRAGHDDPVHAGTGRPIEDFVEIGREGLVAEIRADVDEFHGR